MDTYVRLLWEERVDVYTIGAKTFMARLGYMFEKQEKLSECGGG